MMYRPKGTPVKGGEVALTAVEQRASECGVGRGGTPAIWTRHLGSTALESRPVPALGPALVLAWVAGAPCDDARNHYEALSPERALDVAQAALARDDTRPLPCLEIRALALLVMGRREDARAAFAELFERDPRRVIDDPSLSPPLAALIEAEREAARPLAAQVRVSWAAADALRLDVVLDGGLRGAKAVRWQVAGTPAALAAAGQAQLSGRVATATVAVGAELDVARLVVRGAVVGGAQQLIHRFDHETLLGPRPIARGDGDDGGLGWGWLLVGGLVVGAAAAGVSIAVLAQPELPDTGGTIGRVDVDR